MLKHVAEDFLEVEAAQFFREALSACMQHRPPEREVKKGHVRVCCDAQTTLICEGLIYG